MCDCPCQCWHTKPIRQRLTNTFIHTDIFNYNQPNPLNVKCYPIPGQPHNCKCNNLFQKPVVKDTRFRPRDHPSDHFYNQYLGHGSSVPCVCGTRPAEPIEAPERQYQFEMPAPTTMPVRRKGPVYCFEEKEPAGKYTVTDFGPGCCRSKGAQLGKSRGIHTGDVTNYDRHESNKDLWFNDGKESKINRLNSNITRAYSAHRKQIYLDSHAFDFVDDDIRPYVIKQQTAKFQTSRFENDCQMPVRVVPTCQPPPQCCKGVPADMEPPQVQYPPQPTKQILSPKIQQTVTFKYTPVYLRKPDAQPTKKVEKAQKSTKAIKSPAVYNTKPAESIIRPKCNCKCQCYQTRNWKY